MISKRIVLAATLIWSLFGVAFADDYPSRPIRLIVPFPAGGSADIAARAYADKMAAELGKPVVIDNRPGASGTIGVQAAANAEPDGYTLVLGSPTPISILPPLMPKAPYDVEKDLVPVSLVTSGSHVLAVGKAMPVSSFKEFVSYAKAQSEPLSFGTFPISPFHIGGYIIQRDTGVKFNPVMYKGTAPAIQDLVGGHIQVMLVEVPVAAPFIASGQLKALGVSALKREPLLPDVPTLNELGLTGFDITGWFGVFAPAKTDPQRLALLGKAIRAASESPEVIEKLKKLGVSAVASDPAQFAEFIKRENAKWARAVKESGVQYSN